MDSKDMPLYRGLVAENYLPHREFTTEMQINNNVNGGTVPQSLNTDVSVISYEETCCNETPHNSRSPSPQCCRQQPVSYVPVLQPSPYVPVPHVSVPQPVASAAQPVPYLPVPHPIAYTPMVQHLPITVSIPELGFPSPPPSPATISPGVVINVRINIGAPSPSLVHESGDFGFVEGSSGDFDFVEGGSGDFGFVGGDFDGGNYSCCCCRPTVVVSHSVSPPVDVPILCPICNAPNNIND